MDARWSTEDLNLIGTAGELQIAVRRPDSSLRQPLPIWVVSAGEQIYVRSWHRRDTGWFGHALQTQQARIYVPGLEADVTIEDVGDASPHVTAAVDDAYRAKYGNESAASMITSAATKTTLRLDPE